MSKPDLDRDIAQTACQEYLTKIGNDKRVHKPNLTFVGIVLGYTDDSGGVVVSSSSAWSEKRSPSPKFIYECAAKQEKE